MCKYDSTFKIQLHNAHFKVLCFKVLKLKIEIQDLSCKLQLANNIELYDIFIKKNLQLIIWVRYYIEPTILQDHTPGKNNLFRKSNARDNELHH